jgi:hypothetical protein
MDLRADLTQLSHTSCRLHVEVSVERTNDTLLHSLWKALLALPD